MRLLLLVTTATLQSLAWCASTKTSSARARYLFGGDAAHLDSNLIESPITFIKMSSDSYPLMGMSPLFNPVYYSSSGAGMMASPPLLPAVAKVQRPGLSFVSNARPINIYSRASSSLSPAATIPSDTSSLWLGKFAFNGRPGQKVNVFGQPYSDIYFEQEAEAKSEYNSAKLFNQLF